MFCSLGRFFKPSKFKRSNFQSFKFKLRVVSQCPQKMTTTLALKAPFDDPTADVVLRSSDNVDFHVHKLLLSLVSPVFETMFTLPQTSIESNEGVSTKSGLPIITLAEDSEVLWKLLTWCDPRCVTAMDEQVDIQIALQLADKYDMSAITNRAMEALRRLSTSEVKQEPMGMYAIACKHGFQDIALSAAKAVLGLKMSEFPYVPQLRDASGAAIYRLYDYHFACRPVVLSAVDDLKWYNTFSTLGVHALSIYSQPCHCAFGHQVMHRFTSSSPVLVKDWFWNYLDLVRNALDERPCSATIRSQNSVLSQTAVQKKDSGVCVTCRPTAHITLETFSKALAAEVDRVIETVGNPSLFQCCVDSRLSRYLLCSKHNHMSSSQHRDCTPRRNAERVSIDYLL